MKEWLSKYGLSLGTFIVSLALLVIILTQKKPDYSLFEYQLKQARDSAKLYQPTIDSLTKVVNTKEDLDFAHLDSVLHETIEANNKTIYALKHQKETINTDTLSSSDLTRYFSTIR